MFLTLPKSAHDPMLVLWTLGFRADVSRKASMTAITKVCNCEGPVEAEIPTDSPATG